MPFCVNKTSTSIGRSDEQPVVDDDGVGESRY